MQFLRPRSFESLFVGALVIVSSAVAGCSGKVANGADEDTDSDSGGSGADIPPVDPNFRPIGDPDINKLECGSKGRSGVAAPLRRLTRKQYTNTLNDLFGGLAQVPADLQLPAEPMIAGFDNNALAQSSTLALMQGYNTVAVKMSKDATSDAAKLGKLAPCAAGQSETTCANQFIKDFGKRAFRRPLATDEAERLAKVFNAVHPVLGYAQGIEVTVTAVLMSPAFLFRPEYGAGAVVDGALKLSPHEVAARLSYLLWDSMPDAELFAAADANKLDSSEELNLQVRRMAEDDRARASILRFESQWLGLAKIDNLEKDDKAFPNFDSATKTSLRISAEKFLEYAFWEKGSLHALLTDSNAFVDDKVAPIYGVTGSGAMRMVSLDASQRSGVLTQAGLMASLAKADHESPVHRGLFVIQNLLCSSIPNAPNYVPPLADVLAGDAPRTTRERIEASHNNPQCAACHRIIDGIGFAFGHYDAIGAYRDRENGINVNATGELVGTRDIDGAFDGAVELGAKLAQSSQVQQCVATQWFRYALGRTETDSDACALKPIADAFVASRGDLRQLLTILTKSDAFRYRNAL